MRKTMFGHVGALGASAALLGALAACGGGGGGSGFPLVGLGGGAGAGGGAGGGAGPGPGTAAPPPGPVTVAGKVVVLDGVGDALVCIDRNLNRRCDADEPQAPRTGADGAYSFTYTPTDAVSAEELLAAPLLAEVAGANATLPVFTEAFVMSAPAGHRAQINPLTTLVQAGVAGGLSLERAEAAASLQLGLPVAQFYDYQDVPRGDLLATWDDDAWTMTALVADALHEAVRQGVSDPLRVLDPATVPPTPTDQLAQLSYTSPSNYFAQHYPSDGIVDSAAGRVRLTDAREGQTAGSPTAHGVLYPQVRLGSTGWVRCDETAAFTSTLGAPSRSDYCGDSTRSVGYTLLKDVAGQKMADVLQAIRSGAGNTLGDLDPASALADPAATFPAGSMVRYRKGFELVQPMYINLLNDGTGFGTIEAFIAGSPNAAVNPATGAGTRNLGLYDTNSLLRFAATTGDGLEYYRCDSNPPNYTTLSNCVSLGTGTWRLVQGLPGNVRAIEFPNMPQPTPRVATTLRYYAEFEGQVYAVRRNRPEAQYNLSVSERLNGSAWEALKVQLGLVSP